MLEGKWAKAARHIAAAVAYGLAYLALREASNDQWFLPAGLRFVALLVAPTRFWPALFAGEVLALGYVRYPMIPEYGVTYGLASPFLVWPVVASVVHQLRKRSAAPLIHRAADAVALLVAALLSAELASLVNKLSSFLLRSGDGKLTFSDLITYSLGDFQGIVFASFAMALCLGKCINEDREESFRIEAAMAATGCAVLAFFVADIAPSQSALLEAGRLVLLVPAIVLATRHGWRGACAGAIISNVALFATIPHQEAGHSDSVGLMMQETFTFVGCALFVLGARIHERALETARSAAAADEARRLAKANFETSETQLRERALRAEQMHESSQETIRSTISWLRSNGHSEVAMGLMGAAHRQAQHFERMIIDGMYPLTLERDGLFASLMAESFQLPFERAQVACNLDLLGSPHGISMQTQLAAYRVIVEASEFLMGCSPKRLQVRVRCTQRAGRGHISVALSAHEPGKLCRTAEDTAHLARLRGRAETYEGSFHSRAGRLRIILLDAPTDAPPAPRRWKPRIVSQAQTLPMT